MHAVAMIVPDHRSACGASASGRRRKACRMESFRRSRRPP
ncbi:hypothetical protein HMPREF0185_00130 [Brevundimonas diminuta 470-4]|nr:hypothetical protein HMPREF0185_00130 [Brevundimonas diminuta 470-4]